VAGKTAFDANGDQAVAEFTVKKIENGKAVIIKYVIGNGRSHTG